MRLLNIKQVAELLQIHEKTIYKWIKKGKFPKSVKRWGSSRWDYDEIMLALGNKPLVHNRLPDKTKNYLLEALGPPSENFSGRQMSVYRRPVVYAWVRESTVLYIGKGQGGLERPFTKTHHQLMAMLPDDELLVWFFDTIEKAEDFESLLIRTVKPVYNSLKNVPLARKGSRLESSSSLP